MFTLIIIIVAGIILLTGLAMIINKIPRKLHPIIVIVLLLLCAFFAYQLYKSIEEPVKFEAAKEERYKGVVAQLMKIREAQNAHKSLTGDYSNDINKLERFIDTAQFPLIQKRDSTVIDQERNKKFRLRADDPNGYKKEITISDTLGFTSVKDSLFKNVAVGSLLKYKVEGTPGEIKMETGYVFDKENRIPVFKVTAMKKDILFDQPKRLVKDELEARSVEAIDGPSIFVGSLDEITTSGNWPRQYAIDEK